METGAGMYLKLEQTGLLDGLDMRGERKGGSKDAGQVCEPRNQCWCHLRRWQDRAGSRFGGLKLGILRRPTPRLGMEKTPVFADSHMGLVCYLSGAWVYFHWLCTHLSSGMSSVIPIRPARSSPSFPHFLLTPPSLSQQL